MTNFITTFKNEITRIARKELRTSIDPMRKQLVLQRRDIAALKRERDQLKREVAALARTHRRSTPTETETEESGERLRFSATGLQSLRKKLGLSREDFAYLAGVSSQSVYNWEHGKTRPRTAQIQRVASLRGIGKREAGNRLAALRKPKRKARAK